MTISEYWTMYFTIFSKEAMRVLRIWPQSLLPSTITITLYFLIFGKVIGSKVGIMSGIPYIEFITPGLIIMAVINNAYANVASSFYGSRFNQSIEELLVSPMPNHLIILGFISGGISRGFIVGILVSIIASLFNAFTITHFALFILAFIFCSGLFSLAGLLNGIFSQSFDDITIFPTFILTPLIYLGGVFYSLDSLSPTWQFIAKLNPIFYIVDLFRYASLGVSAINPAIAFVTVVGFCCLLYGIVLYCLTKGIRLKA